MTTTEENTDMTQKNPQDGEQTQTQLQDTDIFVVLDSSGSMEQNRHATVSGANEAIDQEKQRWEADTTQPKPNTFLTFITFSSSDNIHVHNNRIPISDWNPLTDDDYRPDGRTSLNDAAKVAFDIEIPVGNRVLYIFITDGDSNADQIWRPKNVKEHVETFKTNWLDSNGEPLRKVLYVGCQDGAIDAADSCGVDKTCSLHYDEERTPEAWSSVGRAITRTASGSKGPMITEDDRASSSAAGH